MNHTINDKGESVIAEGAPGSLARMRCESSVPFNPVCSGCGEPAQAYSYSHLVWYCADCDPKKIAERAAMDAVNPNS